MRIVAGPLEFEPTISGPKNTCLLSSSQLGKTEFAVELEVSSTSFDIVWSWRPLMKRELDPPKKSAEYLRTHHPP